MWHRQYNKQNVKNEYTRFSLEEKYQPDSGRLPAAPLRQLLIIVNLSTLIAILGGTPEQRHSIKGRPLDPSSYVSLFGFLLSIANLWLPSAE